MTGFDCAGGGLGQERREEQEVVGRDEQDPLLAMVQTSFEFARGVRSTESTTDDHDVVLRISHCVAHHRPRTLPTNDDA